MGVRHLELELTVVGPVHIGNGETLGKKDYFIPKGTKGNAVAVLDAKGFVAELEEDQLDIYSRFLKESSRMGLQELFDDEPELAKLAEKHAQYKVNTRLAERRGRGYQYFDVAAFIKDPYGHPYIPGSSMKGIIRTALLCELISQDPKAYQAKYSRNDACDRRRSKTAGSKIEKKALWIEDTDGEEKNIRDIMHHISVSDSEPLDVADLVFVKKYDKFAKADDGRHKHDMGNLVDEEYLQGNNLNIYRECIRPGTKAIFHIDIDDAVDGFLPKGLKLDAEGLTHVFAHAHGLYREAFLEAFDLEGGSASSGGSNDGQCSYILQSGPFAGSRCRNKAVDGTGYCNTHAQAANEEKPEAKADEKLYCYVGGGTDYSVKTILRALFETQKERVEESSRILYSQFPTKIAPGYYTFLKGRIEKAGFKTQEMKAVKFRKDGSLEKAKDDHRHWRDNELGVSPHTIKLGICEGKKLQMGKCEVRIISR